MWRIVSYSHQITHMRSTHLFCNSSGCTTTTSLLIGGIAVLGTALLITPLQVFKQQQSMGQFKAFLILTILVKEYGIATFQPRQAI